MARRTRSEFLRTTETLNQAIQDIEVTAGADDPLDDLRGQVEFVAEAWRELADAQTEKYDNLPEGLQSAPLGELLESRADAANEVASDLEGIDLDPEIDLDEIRDEVTDEIRDEVIDEATDDTDVVPDDAAIEALMATPEVVARVEARVIERRAEVMAERLDEVIEEIHGIEYQGE